MIRRNSIIACLAILAIAPLASAASTASQTGTKVTLTNGEITLTFDLATGLCDASTPAGGPFATGMRFQVGGASQGATDDKNAQPAFTSSPVKDKFGPGIQARFDYKGALPFTLTLTVYDRGAFFLSQVRVANKGDLRIRQMLLPSGQLSLGKDLNDVACLVNYWSGNWYTEIHPVDLTIHRPRWDSYSHFFAVLHNRAEKNRNVVLGAVYSEAATRVALRAQGEPGKQQTFQFDLAGAYEGSDLKVQGDQYVSQPFFVGSFQNVYDGMELYGQVVLAHRPMPLWPKPPGGWCSWDAGCSNDPKGIQANIKAAVDNRLPEYGFEYMQLDDGWQIGSRCSGNWNANKNFPMGMKALADQIRQAGMKPGLWIGPFGEDSGNRVQKDFLLNPNGGGGYDLSRPVFKQWIAGEIQRFCDQWGYDYIKADFLSYGGSASKTEPFNVVYRDAVRLMKQGIGANRYLMTCINHEWFTVGYADGQRLGNDVQGGQLTGAYVSVINWGRRYFTNNTFWVGDPDMMHVNLPTLEQSRVWASFVALAGGAVMSGDNLAGLKPERIELIKKTLPPAAITARPVDLFDRPTGYSPKFAHVWDAKVVRPWETWHVVGLFNWTVDGEHNGQKFSGQNLNLSIDFARDMGLDPKGRYLVYDFWSGQYVGVFEKGLTMGLPGASCKVLAIHKDENRPVVLGDDRHIVVGAVAIKDVKWDARQQTLSGLTATVKKIPYRLAVYVPPGLTLTAAKAGAGEAKVEKVSDRLAQVSFDTGETGQVEWSIRFSGSPSQPEPTAKSEVGLLPPASQPAGGDEILLRQVLPKWTDQRHDIEGGPVAGQGNDLGTTAPFWACYDITPYAADHGAFLASAVNTSRKEGGKVCFEVVGDGKSLLLTKPLTPGERADIRLPVKDVKELKLVCHFIDGWFSSTSGRFEKPRLVKE